MRANSIFAKALRSASGILGTTVFLLVAPFAAEAQTSTFFTDLALETSDLTASDLDGDHHSDIVLSAPADRASHKNCHAVEVNLSTRTAKQTFTVAFAQGGSFSCLNGEGVGVRINDGTGPFSDGDAHDAVVPQTTTTPLTRFAVVRITYEYRTIAAPVRGAFYIRPPPQFL